MPKYYGQVKGKRYPCDQPLPKQPEKHVRTIEPPKPKPPRTAYKSRSVIVDKIHVYPSIRAAAQATGCSTYTVTRSIREGTKKCGHLFERAETGS